MCDKGHVNKMNIIAIITCFSLIFIFVFGSVQFAFAANAEYTVAEIVDSCDVAHGAYVGYVFVNDNRTVSNIMAVSSSTGKMCAYFYQTDTQTILCLASDKPFEGVQYSKYQKYRKFSCTTANKYGIYGCYSVGSKVDISDFQTQFLTFSSEEDANNYLTDGIVNNPIYDNRSVEYDSSIEIPLMAQCQVNCDKFLFNCKQSEPHDDYKLQISASVSLTPVYSNLTSKQYADTQQIYTSSKSEIGKYDNFDTTFNVSFSSTDLLNGLDTSRSALGFKEFYNGYNILLPYKESVLSKIYFYARNVSGVKCSNWVKVTYDLITETSSYEEVESVAGSDVPSDTKKDSSEYYPDDYIYNDNEPTQDSNSSGIIGYIKSGLGLVGNNSIIALIGNTFSFLPKELTTLLLFGGALLVAVGIIKVVTR